MGVAGRGGGGGWVQMVSMCVLRVAKGAYRLS